MALLGRGTGTFSSASNVLSSIRYFTAHFDEASLKVFDSVLVTSSLKGLKVQLSRPVRQKLPFSVNHLRIFYDLLDFSDVKQLAGWCAMLLCFFGCLRLSNLVSISKEKFDPVKQLLRGDIDFDKGMVLVCFKWSKTNQNNKKLTWIPICKVSDKRFDLKSHLKKLFSLVPVPPEAPLFSYSGDSFHSRHTLVRLLNRCILGAGLRVSD